MRVPNRLGPPLAAPLFERLALIGIGLIGSSIAHVARRKSLARTIVATDADPAVRKRVAAIGLADEVAETADAAVREADLVILCVPVGAMEPVIQTIAPHLRDGALLSDVGSVKGAVVAAATPHLREGIHFVPAHPVAGTENSGPDAGFATLFHNRWCILTPAEGTSAEAAERLADFWRAAGANVEFMSAAHHDLVLAITSHVPHLIAYNIVGTAAHLEEVTQSEVIKFSAGGFRDFTRIAASDPTMWRDVFLNNKEAVLEMLGRFTEDLTALQRMIRYGDGQGLFDLFTHTRAIRRNIIEQGQETAATDFGRGAADKEV
jgi:cyclohexadieny/prephenate dehydrogenase